MSFTGNFDALSTLSCWWVAISLCLHLLPFANILNVGVEPSHCLILCLLRRLSSPDELSLQFGHLLAELLDLPLRGFECRLLPVHHFREPIYLRLYRLGCRSRSYSRVCCASTKPVTSNSIGINQRYPGRFTVVSLLM